MSDHKDNSVLTTSHTTGRKKRRTLGRNARRRRRKVLAIEEAAAAALKGTDDFERDSKNTIIPKDRGYMLPAVKDLCELSDSDKLSLIAQLGYLPGNAIKVVARLKDATSSSSSFFEFNDMTPLVVQLYPLVLRDESDSTKSHRKRKKQKQETHEDESNNPLVEPFPTLYWVTHPRFRALISKLELTSQQHQKTDVGQQQPADNGKRIRQFQEQLKNDSNALHSMQLAHEKYSQERYNLITKNDWEWIMQRKWQGAFLNRGVAGIRDPATIKCLHAHAAHYWSGCKENIVGKWVSEEIHSLLTETTTTRNVAPETQY